MTLVLGFVGKQQVGKSTFGGFLREMFGARGPGVDLEFSDPIIDVVNAAVSSRAFGVEFPGFRRSLTRLTAELTDQPQVKRPPDETEVCSCWKQDGRPCIECELWSWWNANVAGASQPVRLTRENKVDHRASLIWLGVMQREIYGRGVWANEIARRVRATAIAGARLITVGGVRMPGDEEAMRALVRQRGIDVRLARIVRPMSEDTDATAATVDGIKCDTTVHNTSTLDELHFIAVRMRDHLQCNYLAPEYGPQPGAPLFASPEEAIAWQAANAAE